MAAFSLEPIGFIDSPLKRREDAPKQGREGGPEAWIELAPAISQAAADLEPGDEIILITWFHAARRDALRVHPRSNASAPLTGVFSTRSPDRPNPLGLHRVKILEVDETRSRLKVAPLEAIDGTPVVDIKPVLDSVADA